MRVLEAALVRDTPQVDYFGKSILTVAAVTTTGCSYGSGALGRHLLRFEAIRGQTAATGGLDVQGRPGNFEAGFLPCRPSRAAR